MKKVDVTPKLIDDQVGYVHNDLKVMTTACDQEGKLVLQEGIQTLVLFSLPNI